MKSQIGIAALLAAAVSGTPGIAVAQNTPFYYRPDPALRDNRILDADVCIYGGNAAGVAAAVQLARMNRRAIILEPGAHLGGLTTGGLSDTDIGNKAAIGGIAREFYRRVGEKYGVAEEWRFEPHVAEQVLREMIAETKTPVHFRQFLKSVEKKDGRLVAITMESGLTVRAKVFLDTTYEGDLMAKAGVRYTVGREANATYGETINGVQVHTKHQFDLPVDPYVVAGDPASGLLPGITAGDPGATGSGDKRIQAYNFRLCLTNDPENRVAFEKPDGYDPREYVLLGRYLRAGWPESQVFQKFDTIRNSASQGRAGALEPNDLSDPTGLAAALRRPNSDVARTVRDRLTPETRALIDAAAPPTPADLLRPALVADLNAFIGTGDSAKDHRRALETAFPFTMERWRKVDKNNHGATSTDFIGRNYDWPEADYAKRERIFQEHVLYTRGLLWFMGNDPAVPAPIRARWSTWGFAKDEFLDTGGFPFQLYVREARRMVSDYVMTEADCRTGRVADGIGLGAYTMDSHNCQRFVRDGRVWNEGDVQIGGFPPYPISVRSIVPRKAECENLLVPVCLSASHIAYGSIRMEPVFMILSQSAATIAAMAFEKNTAVQDVPYEPLRQRLLADKQILVWKK